MSEFGFQILDVFATPDGIPGDVVLAGAKVERVRVAVPLLLQKIWAAS